MNAALRITNENDAEALGIGRENGLEGKLCGFGKRLAFIQDEKARGGILFHSPVCGEKGEDFLSDGFQASFICRIHGNGHKGLSVSPDAIHEPCRTGCFPRTRGAKQEKMMECMGV